jgi:hypothetical protein
MQDERGRAPLPWPRRRIGPFPDCGDLLSSHMARDTETLRETTAGPPDKQAERRLRRAEALRRNLRRRKEQARGRADAQSEGPDSPRKL